MSFRLPVRAGIGWKEVHPRSIGWQLAWESRGRLHLGETDFDRSIDLGTTGEVESSLAYDAESDRLYRFRSSLHSLNQSYNEITSFCPRTGQKDTAWQIHPLRWIPWFLAKLASKPILVGLVVTDASRPEKPGINLLQQIGIFHLQDRKSIYHPLPAGCQFPVAIDQKNEHLLFHGVDGFQWVTLRGKRIAQLSRNDSWEGRTGAAFHPRDGSVLLSGHGLFHYKPGQGAPSKIHEEGVQPAWSPNGQSIYFLKHSGELYQLDPRSGRTEQILSTIQCRHPEIKMAKAPLFTTDGKYAALPITRRSPLDTANLSPGQPAWTEQQALVVLDLEKKQFWQKPGPVSQVCWLANPASA